MGRRPNTIEDFWRQVDKASSTGCWLWTGCLTTCGYGKIRIANEQHRTHRLAYRLMVGEIPTGLVLDHLCRVRSCCNPAHLEPVTNRENILRGVSPAAQNSHATQCYETTPRCVVGAIGSCGNEVTQDRARKAVRDFLGGVDEHGVIISIVQWNDAPERTAAEVIETLRAAAIIAAAQEQDAPRVVVEPAGTSVDLGPVRAVSA